MPRSRTREIERAFARSERAVMKLAGVNGVALGEQGGEPCIVVYVERATPALRRRVAAACESLPVRVEESGAFEAQ